MNRPLHQSPRIHPGLLFVLVFWSILFADPGDAIAVDPRYHTYDEMLEELRLVQEAHPEIALLDSIGVSYYGDKTIWALKLSDNVVEQEDEPAVLFTGIHHANELLGLEICMMLIDEITSGYDVSPEMGRRVDSLAIWVIPMINPDGHAVVVEGIDEHWRKNTRDNNDNGIFDDGDGVDLNRNYDFLWEMGDSIPESGVYRGPSPFSEPECRAVRDLALAQDFSLAFHYHSPDTGRGEIIYYPWFWGPDPSPDYECIKDFAESAAALIESDTTGAYEARLGNAESPKSRNWMYGIRGCIACCVEVSLQCIPPGEDVDDICLRNLPGAYHLLDRTFGPGVTGIVRDGETSIPLEAEVEVEEAVDPRLPARTSNACTGRYRRLLLPGDYTLAFRRDGYVEQIHSVTVNESAMTTLDVDLEKGLGIDRGSAPGRRSTEDASGTTAIDTSPNPFNPATVIRYRIPRGAGSCVSVSIDVYDLRGGRVRNLVRSCLAPGDHQVLWNGKDDRGRSLPSGVYIVALETAGETSRRRILLLR